MKTLFLKYFFKQKKFVLFFIVFSIIAGAVSYLARINNHNATKREIEIQNNYIKLNEDLISAPIEDLEKAGYAKEDISNIKDKGKKRIEYRKNFIKEIENNNWDFLYSNELKNFEHENYGMGVEEFSISAKTIEITQKTLKFLKENKIPSAHPLTLQHTEFDQPRTTQEKNSLLKISGKTLLGTNHRLWDFFNNNLILIYIFIIAVGTGTLFAGLYENHNKTIRFLKSSGISKTKIYGSGLFVGIIFTVLLGISMILIVMAIEYTINGASSLNYPIVEYSINSNYFSTMEMNYDIVPISKVLQRSIYLFLLYGIFIFLISSIFSIIFKSKVKSIIATFGTFIGLQMFTKHYNPFSYWRVGKIVDGSINPIYRITTYSYSKSIQILLISTFILFAIFIIFSYFERKFKED